MRFGAQLRVVMFLSVCIGLAVGPAARAAEPTSAAAPAAGVPWTQLSDDQRKLLSDLEARVYGG